MTPTLSQHALQRLVDMGITAREIKLALDAPEIRRHGSDSRFQYWRRGRIDLVVDAPNYTIVTALWSTEKLWDRDQRTTKSRSKVRR